MERSHFGYHFIGIGGIGMSALARILIEKGDKVQGTDLGSTGLTQSLKEAGASIFQGHDKNHIKPEMTVVYSSAIQPHHPEFQEAQNLRLQILHRSELLSSLMQDRHGLVVTGTHGKTTTTTLLAYLLTVAGFEPSFALGGVSLNLNTNGSFGKGRYFVAEADESDGSFLKHPCAGAIVTNLENEHLDYWKTEEALKSAFRQFGERVANVHLFFWCADDPNLAQLGYRGWSYGFSENADLRVLHFRQEEWKIVFDITFQGKTYENITAPLVGKHNALNAAAVFGLGLQLGLEESVIRKAFASFKGIKRRLEKKGEVRAVEVYDDYAHHPQEIRCTLEALKTVIGERRLVVAFQPHRYTRTQNCYQEFITAFDAADVVLMTEIYPAGESPIPGICSEALVKEIQQKGHPEIYLIERQQMASYLTGFLKPHDVLVSMGAGDITYLGEDILQADISKLRIAYLMGGKSMEHEVSLLSAQFLKPHFNPHLYELLDFTITKEGEWKLGGRHLTLQEAVSLLLECDLSFPMIHGNCCEDGMIQGFLETLGVTYCGVDYRGGPIAMDKAWAKILVQAKGVKVADFLSFEAYEWEKNQAECIEMILKKFSFPLFVKPAHLGSTFGVYQILDAVQLKQALSEICKIDDKFLIEDAVEGREIEIGIFGDLQLQISEPAEVLKKGDIYTYEGKYDPETAFPANLFVDLAPEVIAEGKKLAEIIYRATGCSGFARIDFFLKDNQTWIFNEINPIPGCTPTSVYPKFWSACNLSISSMVDQVVIAAFHRKRRLSV